MAYPSPTLQNVTVNGALSLQAPESASTVLAAPQSGSGAPVFRTLNASEVGALPIVGGTLTGDLTVPLITSNTGSGTTAGTFITYGSKSTIIVEDTGGSANILLAGNGSVTPYKYIRSASGSFEIVNSGYSAVIFGVDDSGNASVSGGLTVNGGATIEGPLTLNSTENANAVLAGPESGSAAAPTFRSLVPSDYPVFVASGTNAAAGAVPNPGTTAGSTRFLREDSTWVEPSSSGGVATFNGRSGAVVPESGDYASDYLSLNGGTLTGDLTVPLITSSTAGTTAGTFITSGSNATLVVEDTGGNGANILLEGNGSVTPNKYIRSEGGSFQIINSAYSGQIFGVDDSGNASVSGGLTVDGGATVGGLTVEGGATITGKMSAQSYNWSTSAPTNLSIGASPWTYTNGNAFAVFFIISGASVSGTSISITPPGGSAFALGLLNASLPLGPGWAITITYSTAPSNIVIIPMM